MSKTGDDIRNLRIETATELFKSGNELMIIGSILGMGILLKWAVCFFAVAAFITMLLSAGEAAVNFVALVVDGIENQASMLGDEAKHVYNKIKIF